MSEDLGFEPVVENGVLTNIRRIRYSEDEKLRLPGDLHIHTIGRSALRVAWRLKEVTRQRA